MLLETPRLRLRRFQPGDAPALAAYRSDPEVARYKSWTAPVSIDSATAFVRACGEADPGQPGWFQYAIELKADGSLAGDVGVRLHDNRMQADLGVTLAAGRQRSGYAIEAVRAVLEDLFTRRGLHRVSAECDARNTRSAQLLERAGFQLEGRRPEFTWLKDEWTDDLLFGLLADRWRQLN
ncbi:GNAT family protein [Streptomyces sp. H10-C2]|uniref:GNAT family N-acetyltransferase n=1 Tax=unclassified Streptomyces TaxID=2593676 RepID=UPI0024BABE49|nr:MULTISPECIES: GNAT family protein [unclassified Streptomyces]MDJ0345149.1 GNAT family protein [Streptomyces sp. PH10-H1]MDJ0374117.1 GNAT family protein [Streptomyces sp. H10-C2]